MYFKTLSIIAFLLLSAQANEDKKELFNDKYLNSQKLDLYRDTNINTSSDFKISNIKEMTKISDETNTTTSTMIENSIKSNTLENEAQNLKEQIPLIVSVGKENLVKEINITSRFLRFKTLFATFLGGFFVGALLLFFYHILYMQKHNEYITFFLMGNDKEFAKTQIDKASSFLAGYNSNKDLIIKIYNKENK